MIYVQIFIAGMLGIFLHQLKKIDEINKRNESETYATVLKMFYKKELISMIMSVVFVIGCMYVVGAGLKMKSEGKTLPWAPASVSEFWDYFINPMFFSIGVFGDIIFQYFFGRTEREIQKKANSDLKKDA